MQVFVPESRRAKIVVEVGRMEERQADLPADSSILPRPEIEFKLQELQQEGSALAQEALGQSSISNGARNAVNENNNRSSARKECESPMSVELSTKPVLTESKSKLQTGRGGSRAEDNAASNAPEDKEGTFEPGLAYISPQHEVVGSAKQQPLTASQEQEDILEAWRKKRRQELAARDDGSTGGAVHKRGFALDDAEYSASQHSSGTDAGLREKRHGFEGPEIQGKGEGNECKHERAHESDEEDEELLRRLRKRLGVDPGSAHSPSGPVPSRTMSAPASVSPHKEPSPHPSSTQDDFATISPPHPQNPETSPEPRPSRHSFPQSPRGEFSHPVRFSSKTPPVSPRRSLSPASRGGKRSSSEPATSRMHPSFSSQHMNQSASDVSSPSSSASESDSKSNTPSRRMGLFEVSPPSTPTSRGGIFEPPARRSSLLTPEDEALLAAMSLVGRTRSRSSPANKRLPRGGSGLPPQHVPPSQLRRAVSIDPRVEARAVEQRAAEKLSAETKQVKEGNALEANEAVLEKRDAPPMGFQTDGSSKKEGVDGMQSMAQEGKESGEREEKRMKGLEGHWARHISEGPGETRKERQMLGSPEAEARIAAPEDRKDASQGVGVGPSSETGGADLRTQENAAGQTIDQSGENQRSPEARPEGGGQGRVRGLNKGLVLQILGIGEDDEFEGFGRFLSPVRTKVSDADGLGRSGLVRKRSNSFSEFTTVPSPPKIPGRLRGSFERGLEEWSPQRTRKGFGFAGFRGRKHAPMQPAVANLIAETVEDFWSSDLMGAWGMGQSEPENNELDAAGEKSSEADRNESVPLHRRVISEDSFLAPIAPQPGDVEPPPSPAESLPPVSLEGGLPLNEGPQVAHSGTEQGASESQRFEKQFEGGGRYLSQMGSERKNSVGQEQPASHVHLLSNFETLRNPLAHAPKALDEAAGSPANIREHLTNVRNEGETVNCPDLKSAETSKRQSGSIGMSDSSYAHVIDDTRLTEGGRARVGPPLLDYVFEDGPDVRRLREEIHQREDDIRRLRSSRDH